MALKKLNENATLEEFRLAYAEAELEYNTMEQDLNTYKNTLKDKEDRITELQNYNQQLFMRVSHKVDDSKDNEEVEEEKTYSDTDILNIFKGEI